LLGGRSRSVYIIMALVNVLNVTVLDNPTAFTNPFQFEVQFECLQALEDGAY
jgi:histone chaperone ASF1